MTGSTTYTAWDGEELPWPPPENWYRAVDGRWWHPAHGPDDPPTDETPDAVDAPTDSTGSANRQRNRPATERNGDSSDTLDTLDTLDAPDTPDTMESSDTLPMWDAARDEDRFEGDAATAAEPEPEPESPAPTVEQPAMHLERPGQGPDHRWPVESEPDRRSQWINVALVALFILAIAAFAQVAVGRATTDIATGPDSGDSTGEVPSDDDAIVDDDGADRDDGNGIDDDGGNEDVAGDDDTGSSISTDDGADPDDGSGDQAEPDPDVAAGIADFRSQMEERDLSTDELADDQIITFASTYCVYATGAEDKAAFDELRQVAVTTSKSSLTPEQLNLTITTAIMVFCPDESERLGINYDASP